jgi:hypothetical protein
MPILLIALVTSYLRRLRKIGRGAPKRCALPRHKRASNALHEAMLSSERHFEFGSRLEATHKKNAEELCGGNPY